LKYIPLTGIGVTLMTSYATKNEVLIYIRSYATGTSTELIQQISDDDSQIVELLAESSRLIDNVTGREFFLTTGTFYYEPVTDETLFLDRDFASIVTVTNGDGSVISSNNYKVLPLNETPKYAIKLKSNSGISWTDNGSDEVITVYGVSGISPVPEEIKLACILWTVALYRQRNGESPLEGGYITPNGTYIIPGGTPKSVAEILAKWIRTEYK